MADKEMQRDSQNRNMEETRERTCISPLSEITEQEGKIVVKVEMPGVTKDNVNIQLDNDELRISGKRIDTVDEGEFLLRERPCADYEKVFTIDETIDREKVDAAMENGVLTLTLQIKEEVKPRKIEVKSG
jgi:HSP20 family protein